MAQPRRVLAAIDLGPASDHVLDTAIGMASSSPDGELYVLCVSEPSATGLGLAMPQIVPAFRPDLDVGPVKECAERAIGKYRAANHGARVPKVEVHNVMGSPATEIVKFAAESDVDCVVLGTHGYRGIERLLLGSVAEKVVRSASCPVMVAREKTHGARPQSKR